MSNSIPDEDALAERLGQIADEFTERLNKGERPDVEAYARSNPELAGVLREVLPAVEAMRSSTSPSLLGGVAVPAVLGDYRIVREVGRGGMGIVYEAEQVSFPRKVALKVLPLSPAVDGRFLARFQREAKTAAGLHHTNIVPVYAVGCEQGAHYYAMQYIEGRGLDQVLREWRAGGVSPPWSMSSTEPPRGANAPRSPGFVAQLGLQVAEALDYAHQRGVVHRDVKPSNLLLDSAGIVWITDFGLVKNLGEDDNLTRSGDVVGTARYMSPEQTLARRGPVDRRSDVYALGVTLYELLTLRPAIDGADQAALLHQLAYDEPPAPRALDPDIPRDLETIVTKAMAKNPHDRYATAGALAADLRRYLAGEPILARPLNVLERAWRWCRRNPVVAGLTAAVAASLLAGAGIASYFALQALSREKDAVRERDRADAKTEDAVRERDRADRKAAEADANARRIREEKRIADRHLYVAHMNLAQQAWERGHVDRLRALLDGLKPQAGEPDLRGFDWHYFDRLAHRDLLSWPAHEHAISSAAYAPDGKLLATGSYDRTIQLWDPESGEKLGTLTGHQNRVTAVAFADGGKTLVSASHDRTVRLWDLVGQKEVATLPAGSPVGAVAASADGKWLAAGCIDGAVLLWESPARTLVKLEGHADAVRAVAFAPDGTTLASGSGDLTARLWDLKTKQCFATLEGHQGEVRGAAFSPDSNTLATGSRDRTVRLWDVTIGMRTATLRGHDDVISAVAFSPDGQTVASAEGDSSHLFLPGEMLQSRPGGIRARPGAVKLWDVATGLERGSLRGPIGPVYAVAYAPDGKSVVSGGDDMTVFVWDAGGGRTTLPGHMREVNCVAFSADGKVVGSASDDRTIRFWDSASGRLLALFSRNLSNFKAITFSPDGKLVAVGGGDRMVRLLDTATWREVAVLRGHAHTVRSLAFTPDSRTLASGAGDPGKEPRPSEIKLWDVATRSEKLTLKGHNDVVRFVAFAPDGKTLASGSDDRTVKLWDPAAGRLLTTISSKDGVRSVAYSPDGRTLAIACGDAQNTQRPAEVKLWDLQSAGERAILQGHRAAVLVVAFSPDGQTLASGSTDGSVKVWDAATGQERADFEGHKGLVRACAFSPDGKVLATGDNEALVRLWVAGR